MSVDQNLYVVADMERIFKPLAGRSIVTAFHHDVDVRRRRAGRRWRRVTLAAPALVLVVAGALAIGYGVDQQGPGDMAGSTLTAPLSFNSLLSDTAPSAAPARALLVAAPASSAASATDARRLATNLAPIPEFALPRRASELAEAPPAPAPASVSSRIEIVAPSRTGPEARSIEASAAMTVEPGRRERPETFPAATACASDSSDDRCIYQDFLEADADLRLAYDRARRGGVSKLWLSAVSRRWNRALGDAEDDPEGTIRRYERLASALDQERREVAR